MIAEEMWTLEELASSLTRGGTPVNEIREHFNIQHEHGHSSLRQAVQHHLLQKVSALTKNNSTTQASIDTHFGISMPFCLEEPAEEALAALRVRRKDRDLSEVVAVGSDGLRNLISEHIDQGLSKFVVRPLSAMSADSSWRDELRWLADAVLDLQT